MGDDLLNDDEYQYLYKYEYKREGGEYSDDALEVERETRKEELETQREDRKEELEAQKEEREAVREENKAIREEEREERKAAQEERNKLREMLSEKRMAADIIIAGLSTAAFGLKGGPVERADNIADAFESIYQAISK